MKTLLTTNTTNTSQAVHSAVERISASVLRTILGLTVVVLSLITLITLVGDTG